MGLLPAVSLFDWWSFLLVVEKAWDKTLNPSSHFLYQNGSHLQSIFEDFYLKLKVVGFKEYCIKQLLETSCLPSTNPIEISKKTPEPLVKVIEKQGERYRNLHVKNDSLSERKLENLEVFRDSKEARKFYKNYKWNPLCPKYKKKVTRITISHGETTIPTEFQRCGRNLYPPIDTVGFTHYQCGFIPEKSTSV